MKAFGLVIALSFFSENLPMMTELVKTTREEAEELQKQLKELCTMYVNHPLLRPLDPREEKLFNATINSSIVLMCIRLIQEKLAAAGFITTTGTNVSTQTAVSPGNRSYADVVQEKADK